MGKTLVFTGGHHTSALEVAKALKAKGWEIIWFGHRHSMWGDKADSGEYKEVTGAGIKFYDLKAGKFYRTFHPLKLIRIPFGFLQAAIWLLQIRPQGIVSFGGYLAVPTVIMGSLFGIKSVTHEQTVVTGWANKLLSHFVDKIAVTWPNSLGYYPKDKATLIGLPLREGLDLDPKNKKSSTKPIIYITGGKQGSHALNEIIFSLVKDLSKNYLIIHQTGTSTVYNDYVKSLELQSDSYQSFDFDSAKAIDALNKASIVISRSGAHIIYELGILGKRSVLVPIPWVSHKEQDVNAMLLANEGIAIVLQESQLNKERLLEAIEKAKALDAKPMQLPRDATDKMVRLVEQVLG